MRWNVLFAVLFLAYPFFVYFGISRFEPRMIAVVLMVLVLARFFLLSGKVQGTGGLQAAVVLVTALLIGALAFASNSVEFLLFYPVCVNALMFAIFFSSLLKPPSAIERFARLSEPELSDAGVRYTRQVTKVWCVFFIANGAIALYSSLATSLEFWTLYNGGLAYAFMAALFGGEYLFRIWWRRRYDAG